MRKVVFFVSDSTGMSSIERIARELGSRLRATADGGFVAVPVDDNSSQNVANVKIGGCELECRFLVNQPDETEKDIEIEAVMTGGGDISEYLSESALADIESQIEKIMVERASE